MSALTPAGSTWRWRKIRAQVLARDNYRCRFVHGGLECGAPASHVHHIIARAAGGTDEPANLIAACAPCNLTHGEGAPQPPPAALTRRQAALVGALDEAGHSDQLSRPAAARALADLGVAFRPADLKAVCRWRASRGDLRAW